ncbi:NAD-glutamate dehydrogenase domain-containing protein [Nocardia sp. NPDC058176]|uniref:NAD-glutamate dehydrogenase domain-containing protein n=1 Tax=Nocardia sp. NPDC058176 TaxID=3346368 RepID=UPI0036DF0B9A
MRHIATAAGRDGTVLDIRSGTLTPSPNRGRPTLEFDAIDPQGDGALEATLAWPTGTPLLADLVETFAHMGLCVAAHELVYASGSDVDFSTLHRFTFCPTEFAWDATSADLVSQAFTAAVSGAAEVDGFIRLVAAARLPWSEVVLVRAAGRYVRQAGLELSESTITDILSAQPTFVGALIDLFRARFTPDLTDRDERVADADSALTRSVEATSTLDEDRLLRGMWSFVSATLRTNWFQRDRRPDAPVAFKIDPSRVSPQAAIVPHREIFVHAPNVEGSHLRGGPISRGGLRWSDRRDDFRTEVLGLMKTQIVKNSLIVPMGAKGAFVVRSAAEPTQDQVRRAYSDFIGALLDVTDNIVEGAIVHPPDTMVYDGPDPYLVVAADKGTARFSDLANGIAAARGFWLGDGFASGGSAGYDHKKMGITARGAWGSVRRHLAEIGLDIDTDPCSVVGIGDMSGDVFGNGMLLSPRIRLIGAFDHRHIFLDPDPDPGASHRERERLSALARSSWDDYDRAAISPGGGVWPRTSKSISLSPQVRERLGVEAAELPPHQVIQALLRAEVDLLWNGGVGTYVKASTDTNAQAADPANDGVRVDADTLRCRSVGEGGNLGFTQRARVEFALAGGKINADFIDNAAGVATSDREVNLKIALDAQVRSGRLATADRDRLLADLEAHVAASVLADCDRQTLAISLAEVHAPFLLSRHERLIENLEEATGMNRAAEVLPSAGELAARQRAGAGLVRPEIAVLLAMSKNLVRSELLDSSAIDDPVFADVLLEYFPAQLHDRFDADLRGHRVAREIVAVVLANEVIDRVGPGFIHRLEERLGVSTPEIVVAYSVVRAVFDVDRLWAQALSLPDIGQRTRLALLFGIHDLIERATSWLLRHTDPAADPRAEIARLTPTLTGLTDGLPQLTGRLDTDLDTLRVLSQALALGETAHRVGLPIPQVGQAYREIGRVFGLDWVAEASQSAVGAGYWETMAAAVIEDELHENWHALAAVVLHGADPDTEAEAAIATWRSDNPTSSARLEHLLGDLRRTGSIDSARGCVVNAELALAVRGSRISAGGR